MFFMMPLQRWQRVGLQMIQSECKLGRYLLAAMRLRGLSAIVVQR